MKVVQVSTTGLFSKVHIIFLRFEFELLVDLVNPKVPAYYLLTLSMLI